MKRTEKVLAIFYSKSVLGVGSVLICALFWVTVWWRQMRTASSKCSREPSCCIASKSGFDNSQEAASTEVGVFLAEKVTDLGNNPNLSAEELAAAKDEVNQTAAKAQNEIAAAEDKEKGLIC